MDESILSALAIVVVNYGSSELLAINLARVSEAVPLAKIFVVDNFSSASEQRAVSQLCETHVWNSVNLATNEGFGGGMNAGVARARELGCTHFLLLNPDATIDQESVENLLGTVLADALTLASPIVRRPDGSVWFGGSDLYLDDGRIRSTKRRVEHPNARIAPWLSGACLMVSAELWDAVGGFEARYFLYWEDVDLSWKVVAAGGSLTVVESASAVHAEGGTQGVAAHSASGDPKSDTYYYFNIRNRMLFASLRLTAAETAAWRTHSRRIAWEVLLQGGRRQFLVSLSPFRAAFRGIRDGNRIARELPTR